MSATCGEVSQRRTVRISEVALINSNTMRLVRLVVLKFPVVSESGGYRDPRRWGTEEGTIPNATLSPHTRLLHSDGQQCQPL